MTNVQNPKAKTEKPFEIPAGFDTTTYVSPDIAARFKTGKNPGER